MRSTHIWAFLLIIIFIWTNLQPNLALDGISNNEESSVATTQSSSKYAFATIHYEGTPRDDEYLLGIRVLIKSIRMAGHTEDFLVLLTESVKHDTRRILTEAGAKVIEVPSITNPFK